MPLVRITLEQGLPLEKRRAVADAVHAALVEAAGVPADDRFQVVEELPRGSLVFAPAYAGLDHSGPMVFVQVTLNAGRSVEAKQALFARIAAGIEAAAGTRREDVIVNLVEVARESWSFGGGVMTYPPAR